MLKKKNFGQHFLVTSQLRPKGGWAKDLADMSAKNVSFFERLPLEIMGNNRTWI